MHIILPREVGRIFNASGRIRRVGPRILQHRFRGAEVEQLHKHFDDLIVVLCQKGIQNVPGARKILPQQGGQPVRVELCGVQDPAQEHHKGFRSVGNEFSVLRFAAGGQKLKVDLGQLQLDVRAEHLGKVHVLQHGGQVLGGGQQIRVFQKLRRVDLHKAHQRAYLERFDQRLDGGAQLAADQIIRQRRQRLAKGGYGRSDDAVDGCKKHTDDIAHHVAAVGGGVGGKDLLRKDIRRIQRLQQRHEGAFVAVCALDGHQRVRTVGAAAQQRIQQPVQGGKHVGHRLGKARAAGHVPFGGEFAAEHLLPLGFACQRLADLGIFRQHGRQMLRRDIHVDGLQRGLLVRKRLIDRGEQTVERIVRQQRGIHRTAQVRRFGRRFQQRLGKGLHLGERVRHLLTAHALRHGYRRGNGRDEGPGQQRQRQQQRSSSISPFSVHFRFLLARSAARSSPLRSAVP